MSEVRCSAVAAYNNKRCNLWGHPNSGDAFLCARHRPAKRASNVTDEEAVRRAAAELAERQRQAAELERRRAAELAAYREVADKQPIPTGHYNGPAYTGISVRDDNSR